MRLTARIAGTVLLAALLFGCDPPRLGEDAGPGSDAGASPNASILPAPLATEAPELDAGPSDAAVALVTDDAGRISTDAGPAPEALRGDESMTPESPATRDLSGVTLEAAWRWRDVPAPPKGSEVGADGIKEAQRLTALTWAIDLAEIGRMRIEFTSRALPLPARSEIRARTDRYGSVLLWPNATEYRVIAPGALRPLLGERRVDVTPLSVASAAPQGEGKRLGASTRKVELSSPLASLKLELARVSEAGDGAALLCRALVEIAGIDPKVPICQPGDLPLLAVYAWKAGGGITFEATALTRRTDLSNNAMLTPPPGASYAPTGLPVAAGGIFLSREELSAFRTAPLPLPPVRDPGVPGEGFVAVNHSDVLAYLLVDGVPVVAVPPSSERYLIGTTRGRYVVQWRSFLGDRIGPTETVELPARLTHGAPPDAGAPDAAAP